MFQKVRLFGWSVVVILTAILIAGCSGSAGGTDAADMDSAPAPEFQSGSGIQPCKLLTSAQVTTVLPDHDDGMAVLSGGSLMKGVDAYQCSYSNKQTDLFTVVLNIAENDERFSWIKPSSGLHRDDRTIDVGDSGWVYGEHDDLKVEVIKGRTIIDLELMAPAADTRTDAMIELARAITAGLK